MISDSLDEKPGSHGQLTLTVEVSNCLYTYILPRLQTPSLHKIEAGLGQEIPSPPLGLSGDSQSVPGSQIVPRPVALSEVATVLASIQKELSQLAGDTPVAPKTAYLKVTPTPRTDFKWLPKVENQIPHSPGTPPAELLKSMVRQGLTTLEKSLNTRIADFEASFSTARSRIEEKMASLSPSTDAAQAKIDQLTAINRQLLQELQFSHEHVRTIQNLRRDVERANERAEEAEERNKDLTTQLSVLNTRIELTNKLKKKLEKQIALLEEEDQTPRTPDIASFREAAGDLTASALKADLNIIEEGEEFESDNEDSLLFKTTKLMKKISVNSVGDGHRRLRITKPQRIFFRASTVPSKHDRMVQVTSEAQPRSSNRGNNSWLSLDQSSGQIGQGNPGKESGQTPQPNSGLSGEPEISKKVKKVTLFSAENIRRSIFDLQKEKDSEFMGSERTQGQGLPTPRSQHSSSFLPGHSHLDDASPFPGPTSAIPRLFRPSTGGSILGRPTETSQMQDQITKLTQERKTTRSRLFKLQERLGRLVEDSQKLAQAEERVALLAVAVLRLEDTVLTTFNSQNVLTEKRIFGSVAPKPSLEPTMGKRQASSTSNLKREKQGEKNRTANIPPNLLPGNMSREMDSRVTRTIAEKMRDLAHRESALSQGSAVGQYPGSHGKSRPREGKISRGSSNKAQGHHANIYEAFGPKKSAITYRPGSHKMSERNSGFKLSFAGDKKDHGLLVPKGSAIQKQLNFGLEDGEIPLDLSNRNTAYGQPSGGADQSSARAISIKNRLISGVVQGAVARATIDVGADLKNFSIQGEDSGPVKAGTCLLTPSKRATEGTHDPQTDNNMFLLKGSLDLVSKELMSAKRRLEAAHGDNKLSSVSQVDQRIQRMIGYLKSATHAIEHEPAPRESLTKKAEAATTDQPKASRPAAHKGPADGEKKVRKIPILGSRNYKFKRFLYKSDLI